MENTIRTFLEQRLADARYVDDEVHNLHIAPYLKELIQFEEMRDAVNRLPQLEGNIYLTNNNS